MIATYSSLKHKTISLLSLFLFAALSATPPASAQAPPLPPQAPAVEKIFIGNAGPGPDVGNKGGDPEQYAARAYNEFFDAMQQWGRYQIVADPARADWFFEVSITNDRNCGEYPGDKNSARPILENYNLSVLMTDAHTHRQRAGLVEPIRVFRPSDTFDQLFDRAIANLVDDVKKEVGGSATMTLMPSQTQPLAPTPPPIAAAQKVFVESRVEGSREISIADEKQLYDAFVAALQQSGHFLVATQPEADLVFLVSLSGAVECNYWGPDSQLVIYVRDAKTDVSLWAFASYPPGAFLTSNGRKNLTQAITSLATEMRDFTLRPTWGMDASLQPGAPPAYSLVHPSGQFGLTGASPSSQPRVFPSAIMAGLVHLSLPASVKSGTRIMADVTVTNSTKQDLQFYYTQGDPLGCTVTVHGEKGKDIDQTAEGAKAFAAHATFNGPLQTYVLHPKEKQMRQCDVSAIYDMAAPGAYTVEVTELDGVPTSSNIAAVTVKP